MVHGGVTWRARATTPARFSLASRSRRFAWWARSTIASTPQSTRTVRFDPPQLRSPAASSRLEDRKLRRFRWEWNLGAHPSLHSEFVE